MYNALFYDYRKFSGNISQNPTREKHNYIEAYQIFKHFCTIKELQCPKNHQLERTFGVNTINLLVQKLALVIASLILIVAVSVDTCRRTIRRDTGTGTGTGTGILWCVIRLLFRS